VLSIAKHYERLIHANSHDGLSTIIFFGMRNTGMCEAMEGSQGFNRLEDLFTVLLIKKHLDVQHAVLMPRTKNSEIYMPYIYWLHYR